MREHVVNKGSSTTYNIDGENVSARHIKLAGSKIDLIMFEIDRIPYLVVSTSSNGRSIDYIDSAPEAGSFVDTLLDKVMTKKGKGHNQNIPVNAITQLAYDRALAGARNEIERSTKK